MKALVFRGEKSELDFCEVEPKLTETKVKVRVLASALNRRDYYIMKGLYPGVVTPVILGSDACVEYEGKRYVLNPNMDWGNTINYQSDQYRILGMPEDGTFAEWVYCEREKLHDCPRHLTDFEAAALPLAGLTAYRALFTKAELKEGDTVFISGFGGGVASMAFQFCSALGCDIYVSSSSEEKRAKAIEMGAKHAFDYRKEGFGKEMYKRFGGADVIVESAGGKGFNEILDLCKKGARISMYGGTSGMMSLSPQKLFWKQVSLLGTTMGSDAEFSDMVDFCSQYEIKPLISDVFPLSLGKEAFDLLENGGQIGKIVLDNRK